MLVIGRALMAAPTMLLLDEPSLGLAPRVVAQIFDLLRSLVETEGLTVLLVEQNARSALSIADRGVVLNLGRVVADDDADVLAARRPAPPRLPRVLTRRGQESSCSSSSTPPSAGSPSGMVYAAFALALVLIWRSTRIVNFAQAPMAMVTTFIALAIIDAGHSYWLGLRGRAARGLLLGAVIERVVIRPVEGKSEINAVILTLGLFIVLHALASVIFGNRYRSFPAPFGIRGLRGRRHHDRAHRLRHLHDPRRCWW